MMISDYQNDKRIVLTLDAGGSSFRFNATRGGKNCLEIVTLPTHSGDLKLCLDAMIEGFERVRAECPEAPVAISFAFPGPAHYPNGIIDNVGNPPCFGGGLSAGAPLFLPALTGELNGNYTSPPAKYFDASCSNATKSKAPTA